MTDALKARRYAEALVARGGVLVLSPVIYDAIKAASDDPMPDGLIRQGLLPVEPLTPPRRHDDDQGTVTRQRRGPRGQG